MEQGAKAMASNRKHRDPGSATVRRWSSRDDEAALRTASLASPAFKESWRAGAPLDWTEFIARCQSPRRDTRRSDAFTIASSHDAGK